MFNDLVTRVARGAQVLVPLPCDLWLVRSTTSLFVLSTREEVAVHRRPIVLDKPSGADAPASYHGFALDRWH